MSRNLTKQEFKDNWNSDKCDITFEDIADCAIDWGITKHPKTMPIFKVGNMVLAAAGLEPYWKSDETRRG